MIEQTDQSLSVEALCEVLAVSPSGYYAWRHRGISQRKQIDDQLSIAVERVFRASRNTYGSQRVQRALREQGIRTSRKRVYISRQEARQQLFGYIEVFYNWQRLHSGIDFECPADRAAGVTVTPLNWG